MPLETFNLIQLFLYTKITSAKFDEKLYKISVTFRIIQLNKKNLCIEAMP